MFIRSIYQFVEKKPFDIHVRSFVCVTLFFNQSAIFDGYGFYKFIRNILVGRSFTTNFGRTVLQYPCHQLSAHERNFISMCDSIQNRYDTKSLWQPWEWIEISIEAYRRKNGQLLIWILRWPFNPHLEFHTSM